MPRTVWRLTTRAYANLSGEGARRAGGRWNPKGLAAVYTGDSPALCVAEYLVHVRPPTPLPVGLVFLKIELPADLPTTRWTVDALAGDGSGATTPAIVSPAARSGATAETARPADPRHAWREPGAHRCLEIGTAWLAERTAAALDVPSAVVPLSRNVVLDPTHPATAHCRIVAMHDDAFDSRLRTLVAVPTEP